MNIEFFRNYCIDKKGTEETFPFDETTLVLKVMGKMYALTDIEDEFSMTLKCVPEKAIGLKERYSSISGAYHMNKKHWINIKPDGSLSDEDIYQLIDDSYELVKSKLTKKDKALLKNL